VKNDFESLTIFISEFDLQDVIQGFEDASIPESESIQKKLFNGACFPGVERESSGAYKGLI
jgi:hypothetical protein